MKNKIAIVADNIVALVALRGGIACTLIIMANMFNVQQMGKISAIYTTVTAIAQIIGYPLATLAYDLANTNKRDMTFINVAALTCLICWLSVACLIIFLAVITVGSFRVAFFHSLASPALYLTGAFWLCAVALEIMCHSLAMVTGRIRLMAQLSVLQAVLMAGGTFAAISMYGHRGVVATVIASFFSSAMLLLAMQPWRALGFIRRIVRSLIGKMRGVLGPSTMAALFLSGLNIILVGKVTGSENSTLNLTRFAISMQILSICSFIPQILFGITMSKMPTLNQDEKLPYLYKGYFFSLCVCIIISLLVFANKVEIFSIYGQSFKYYYCETILLSLILVVQAPLQILSQRFTIEQRQWKLTIICLVSSVAGYLFFLVYGVLSSSAMLAALLVASAVRLLLAGAGGRRSSL